MRKRTIAIFTGNRAEYGLQYPILRAVSDHPNLDYRLIVSGAHLDQNFGNTLNEIKEDGFVITDEIKIEMDAASLFSNAQAIGKCIVEVSKVLERIKPDFFVVYADRFEGLAAVVASSQMNIPTVHIEGGDLTEGGALDDSVRHAMTKLSHIHFTTNKQASRRIMGMGEEKWRVHTVGFPAIDLITEGNYANRTELESKYNLDFNKPVLLFSQHSVTTEYDKVEEQLNPSLRALEHLGREGVQIIITYPNNDAGGKQIITQLIDFINRNPQNIQLHRSLGRYNYHGILGLATDSKIQVACVGNSSSGIKETPVFGCPTVNIGSRQQGRLRGENVIDADYNEQNIIKAVEKCFFNEEFRFICRNCDNPYYIGDAGQKIAQILSETKIDQKLMRKKMELVGEEKNGWFR